MPYRWIALLLLTGQVLAAEQPIVLPTPTGKLVGTLTMPASAAPHPVALIIAGSGPTDRDGNSALVTGRNDNLKMLAAALAEAGIASVRTDKRGIGESAGAMKSEAELRFDHYVEDAKRWIELLAHDQRFRGVAIIGHSEGSLIGVLAAQGGPARAFVSIAGAGEPAAATIRRQLQGRLPPDLAARNEAILAALEAGRPVPELPAQLMPLYRPSVQPYLASWFRYSPSVEIAKLVIPGLLLQGDTDVQVTLADAESLARACQRCEMRIVRGMNHVMKLVPADPARQLVSYGDPSLPLAPELVQSLTAFLVRSTNSGGNADPLK